MNPAKQHSRREFLLTAGGGAGAIALAAMSSAAGAEAESANPLATRPTHFAPRAKRVIWLFMHGGPSHVDLFDPKPELVRHAGKPVPESFGPVMESALKVQKNEKSADAAGQTVSTTRRVWLGNQ